MSESLYVRVLGWVFLLAVVGIISFGVRKLTGLIKWKQKRKRAILLESGVFVCGVCIEGDDLIEKTFLKDDQKPFGAHCNRCGKEGKYQGVSR